MGAAYRALSDRAFRDRLRAAYALLARCRVCPQDCDARRITGHVGVCKSGVLPEISGIAIHRGEEPPIAGSRGTGAIFFARCNMICAFCYTAKSSIHGEGRRITVNALADAMLELAARGAHSIDLVSPTHFAPQILAATAIAARRGLDLPLVYKTGGYDSLAMLRLLDGVIDIYLPDLKFADEQRGLILGGAPGYVQHTKNAIREMQRQVGPLVTDSDGVARRGLLIRHLVMPGAEDDAISILRWIAQEIGPGTHVSLMGQYVPAHRAAHHAGLNQRLAPAAFARVEREMERLGLPGWSAPP